MITPPDQRSRYLAVVGFNGTKAKISWGGDALKEFFPNVNADLATDLLGPSDTDLDADAAGVEAFGQGLVQMQGAQGTVEPETSEWPIDATDSVATGRTTSEDRRDLID